MDFYMLLTQDPLLRKKDIWYDKLIWDFDACFKQYDRHRLVSAFQICSYGKAWLFMENKRNNMGQGKDAASGTAAVREGRSTAHSGHRNISGRKRTAFAGLILTVSMLLTARRNKENLKDIKAADYVTLGNYMGIQASAPEPVVEDNLVDMYIEYYILPNHATTEKVTDRAVQEGDTANIDFTGYIEGEAFDGGTGTGYDLTIGSHQFIDGFEDGLIGANIGDTVKLDLAFPDPYDNNPDLSGVPVVFEVKVNSISRTVLPELTDEFVQSLNIEECKNETDLRNYVYDYFYQNAVQTYQSTIENTLTDKIMSECTFKEPPAKMIDRFTRNLKDAMNAQASLQNMTLVQYMQTYYGMDAEAYEEKFSGDALTAAQQYIMFQAIADAEGLNPDEDQIQEEISGRVEVYGYESEEAFRESTDLELLREQLMRRNVMEFLKENGNIEMVSTIED